MKQQITICIYVAILVSLQYVASRTIEGIQSPVEELRVKRDSEISWDKQFGIGTIFGTLGNNDDGGLFGKGGYKQDIFNDARGRLEGQAYGTRVLGPSGDSSFLGGKLDWNNVNNDARATVELSKQIHGPTNVDAALSKVWNLDKNTHISAGGTLSQELGRGKPDYGVADTLEHNF